jgi:exosortase/archaeosortase family protein
MTYYLLHYGLRFLIAFGLTFAVLRRIWPAAFIGAAIVALIDVSQLLWVHAAGLTFAIVEWLLSPLLALHADPVARIIGTDRFAVQIAPICSGLEGVGLILAFCTGWLWVCRREYQFPRVLLIVPVAVLAVFLLNAVRIGTLVWIGNAGYSQAAILGFHSMAGWVAFNLTAIAMVVCARRVEWLRHCKEVLTNV